MGTVEIVAAAAIGFGVSTTILLASELGKWRKLTREFRDVAVSYQRMFEHVAEEHARFVMAVYERDPEFVLEWDGGTKVTEVVRRRREGDPPWHNWLEI